MFTPTIGENRQLVTNEPVEFEKEPVEVHNCRTIANPFRRMYRIYPNFIKENRRRSACNSVGLANTRISTAASQPHPICAPGEGVTLIFKHA
jgi:hypothetical protein